MHEHMRTSIDIPDPLLRQAKALARRRGKTVRALVVEGLHAVIERGAAKRAPYRLRDKSFGGDGLVEGLSATDWERIRERTYEGRGG